MSKSLEDQIRAATQLFEDFQGRRPRWDDEIVQIAGLTEPTVALAVGKFSGIGYKKLGDGKLYYHDFSKANLPRIYVAADGKQIFLHGGIYKLTERGFIS